MKSCKFWIKTHGTEDISKQLRNNLFTFTFFGKTFKGNKKGAVLINTTPDVKNVKGY